MKHPSVPVRLCRWCQQAMVAGICGHCDRACPRGTVCDKCRHATGRAA